jgi:ABC-type multidrug transport system fused ATPase/permease subunit
VLPVAAALAWGGWLVSSGHATLGEVTAVALYVVQLADPVDRLISWLDEIQVGTTSFARIVGIATVPPDRTATDDLPEDERLRAHEVRYAYAERDVLHGIDLHLVPGERVAVVGPSGAGKSTLGRLLAGIHPPRRARPTRSRRSRRAGRARCCRGRCPRRRGAPG